MRKKYYHRNPERARAYQRMWAENHRDQKNKWGRLRAQRKRKVLEKLREVPCADCGMEYPFYVMEFDHKEAPRVSANGKRYCMSAVAGMSKTSLMAEVSKCDVVCANCHKERTWLRGAGFRGPIPGSNGQAWQVSTAEGILQFIRSSGWEDWFKGKVNANSSHS